MIVQLEAMEYRGLIGMSLVVFEERLPARLGVWRGEVGDWKRKPSGESRQEPGYLQASILDRKRKHWCLYTKSSPAVTSEDC